VSAKENIVCTPHLGDYSLLANMLIERCLGYKTINCPKTTKKTVEIGAKNSPDTICTPFKIVLGNYIEALELGANILFVVGTGCRLGFFDVLFKQVLTDLGYEFKMLNLFEYNANAIKMFKILKEWNPELKVESFTETLDLLKQIAIDMDELGDYLRLNIAFELQKGQFEENYQAYLKNVFKSLSKKEAAEIGNEYKNIFQKIEIMKPERPLRIGLIGDLYSVMEPHGNCYIEKWLQENKIEMHRPITLTYLVNTLFNLENFIGIKSDYAEYNMGGNATNTVVLAQEMAKNGLDGIIHMKAATCSPEITAMTILQNISKDYNIPIIYFTFDTETSETGVHTRLEAFVDMLEMKREEKR